MCSDFFLLYRFKGCPVIAVAAKPGGPEAPDTEEAQGITELIEVS